MPRVKLTAQFVEKVKPHPTLRVEYADTLLTGFALVVQPLPSGAKSFVVRYRFDRVTRKFHLGGASVLGLGLARERGREALQLVAAGRDPAREKLAASTARRAEDDLVKNIVPQFLDRHARVNNKAATIAEAERTFNRVILPAWGDRKIDSITPEEGIRLLDGIMDQGHPAAAIRAHAVASKFFNWCVERRLLAASPFAHVKKPAQAVSRDRVLSDEELRLMWRAAERIGYPFGTFAQLLALTGQRRDEVAGMRRSEISGDLWTIPGSRTKNGSATEVPLSKAALVAIGSAPTVQMPAIIGPNGRKQSRGASDFVLTTTAETPISGYAKAKAQIDKTMLEIAKDEATKARRNDVDEIKVLPWRLHDLRRTLASGLARLGEPVHVVEAILNHRSGTISGVAAVYNRHSYLPEKRAALKRWAEHLSGITAGSG